MAEAEAEVDGGYTCTGRGGMGGAGGWVGGMGVGLCGWVVGARLCVGASGSLVDEREDKMWI